MSIANFYQRGHLMLPSEARFKVAKIRKNEAPAAPDVTLAP
jgi:hypothetical protein